MAQILGIDPGLRITGYGLVRLNPGEIEPALVDAGVLRLDAQQSMEDRLGQLHADLCELIGELRPTRVAIERLYAHYRHPRTAILMGHARGVILLCANQHQLPVAHLGANEVKKAFTGYGHASKEQMQRSVQAQCRLPVLPEPPDVADAIAIAYTCARRMALERL